MAATKFFDWIIDNNHFKDVEIAALVHDEINIIYKEELKEVPKVLQNAMEECASIICKALPIPADAAVGDHWIH